jgi:ATP-dependent Clp protease protease subunit
MHTIEPDVSTIATGMAASMGQFLLTGGAAGKRFALPHAQVMMHQPSGGAGGSESDIVIRAGMLAKLKKRIAELTAEHSGQPVERIEADFDRDRWFSAQEAVDYGLIDGVLRTPPR